MVETPQNIKLYKYPPIPQIPLISISNNIDPLINSQKNPKGQMFQQYPNIVPAQNVPILFQRKMFQHQNINISHNQSLTPPKIIFTSLK
jgi:hypothetical protein